MHHFFNLVTNYVKDVRMNFGLRRANCTLILISTNFTVIYITRKLSVGRAPPSVVAASR